MGDDHAARAWSSHREFHNNRSPCHLPDRASDSAPLLQFGDDSAEVQQDRQTQ